MFGYRMPTRVHIEPGSVARLPEAARSLGLPRVLLVVDRGLRETPWVETVQDLLTGTGIEHETFDAVEPNPRTTTVSALAEQLRGDGAAGVVALGGGSVLDAAKAAAMLSQNEFRIEQYEGKNRYAEPPLPMVAIPTTCGTGSEVTWVSVLSHPTTRSKISIKGESMFPDQALVDADLIGSLPASMVAWTGLDALTHAIEATVCTAANPVSDALAEKAIALLLRYLPRAAENVSGDDVAREAVMRASTLAGLAFSNADVAAVHCLSESLGGLYDHPHGLLNAMLLLPTLRYHQRFIVDRLADLDGLLSGDDAVGAPGAEANADERAEHFLGVLESLGRRLEVPAFSTLSVPTDDYGTIADHAMMNGSNRSNPQPMAAHNYVEILGALD